MGQVALPVRGDERRRRHLPPHRRPEPRLEDAIYRLCKNQGVFAPDADIYNRCLRDHWTKTNKRLDVHKRKRIDFLFTNAYEIENQITVPQTSPVPYSDHQGQGALLTYG